MLPQSLRKYNLILGVILSLTLSCISWNNLGSTSYILFTSLACTQWEANNQDVCTSLWEFYSGTREKSVQAVLMQVSPMCTLISPMSGWEASSREQTWAKASVRSQASRCSEAEFLEEVHSISGHQPSLTLTCLRNSYLLILVGHGRFVTVCHTDQR